MKVLWSGWICCKKNSIHKLAWACLSAAPTESLCIGLQTPRSDRVCSESSAIHRSARSAEGFEITRWGTFGWSDCTRGWFDQLRHTKSSISSRCRHPRGWLCPLRHWIKLGWNLKRANIVHMVLECCFERFALQMFLAVTSARLRYGILVQFWNLKPGRLCNGRWPDRLASQGQIRQVLRATMLSIRWFVKSWIRPLPQLQGRQYEYLSDLP